MRHVGRRFDGSRRNTRTRATARTVRRCNTPVVVSRFTTILELYFLKGAQRLQLLQLLDLLHLLELLLGVELAQHGERLQLRFLVKLAQNQSGRRRRSKVRVSKESRINNILENFAQSKTLALSCYGSSVL